ncbi:hypothetical protein EAG14_03320 [Acidovorax sp. 1608163]|uniref:hypothetical protein n=1 Tax=Acidovorax sp. 1608163 TaxID=2478662 RepID=UPI000EF74878|nr:hypothetical protein [Acidovorax sp. 1608163]AYM95291.1 hypothetical protein EAG14_03320 [Acidovorax sp. 1608163]
MTQILNLRFATLVFLIANGIPAHAQQPMPIQRTPMVIAPTVEGMYLCDEAVADASVKDIDAAYAYCSQRKRNGSAAISRLLDTLEPGGAKGSVQVGYTATLQLLSIYQKTPQGWAIDKAKVDQFLNVIAEVKRPVVVYFSADHFDSVSPLADALRKDPVNLMQLRDGKPLELNYFGYRIIPYTLSADAAIPVNQYRFEALDYLAKRIKALPKAVQSRIVAYTLAGELHHMFPNFEGGMGSYQDIQVTDYSSSSVAGFRQWLRNKYKGIEQFNARNGFSYASFDVVPAPSKDIRKEKLTSFGEHYDAHADGTLPIAGWLWDPNKTIEQLDLYVNGQRVGPVERGMNRLDVYRAEESITTPNTGYRIDYDYSALPPGRYTAQVIAQSRGAQYKVGEVEFAVVARDQGPVKPVRFTAIKDVQNSKKLPGVRTWLDMPRGLQDVYYNPLARDWNLYRESQVYGFLNVFYDRALRAGLPAEKLYSHQIVPRVNSSWNPQLFAADQTLNGSAPWKQGLNMYGGATDSAWVREFVAQRKITDYGVPEFNPQQWKLSGTHVAAMQSHYNGGARFISPYYFSVIPDRFKGGAEHGVNRMELRSDNPKDGSDHFYRAIIEFAKQ